MGVTDRERDEKKGKENKIKEEKKRKKKVGGKSLLAIWLGSRGGRRMEEKMGKPKGKKRKRKKKS